MLCDKKLEDIFKFTCKIVATSPDKHQKTGTGLFIRFKNDDNGFRYGLLTAAHMAKVSNETNTILFVSDDNGMAKEIKLNSFGDFKWFIHAQTDIALFPITEFCEGISKEMFFPIDDEDLEANPLTRDCELTFFGFPMGLGSDYGFAPFTFHSRPSSGFLKLKAQDSEWICFCLEIPCQTGCSGGPVFNLEYKSIKTQKSKKTDIICRGILSGVIGDDNDIRIASVAPLFLLKDLINEVNNKAT
jgi:hypothetical protein